MLFCMILKDTDLAMSFKNISLPVAIKDTCILNLASLNWPVYHEGHIDFVTNFHPFTAYFA